MLIPRTYIALFLLSSLSILGSYYPVPIFSGIDFTFSGIAVFLAIHLFGVRWGLVVAALAGYFSIASWGHPGGAVFLILEALFIGLVWHRYHYHLLLLTSLFWLSIGLPLLGLFYRYLIPLDITQILLIFLKSLINDIINAAVTCLLINYLPLMRWVHRVVVPYHPPLHQLLLSWIAMFVLLPTLIVMTINGWQFNYYIEKQIYQDLDDLSQDTVTDLHLIHHQHVLALHSLADVAVASDPKYLFELKQRITLLFELFPEFLAATWISPSGKPLFVYPEAANRHVKLPTETLPPPAAPTTSLTTAIHDQDTQTPMISHALTIEHNGEKLGNLRVYFDFSKALYKMHAVHTDTHNIRFTLTDVQGRILNSTRTDLTPLTTYPSPQTWHTTAHYARLPDTPVHPLFYWHQAIYTKHTLVENNLPFVIIIEMSAPAYIDALLHLYIRKFVVIVLIALLGILLANLISRRLTEPLLKLTQLTNNFPQRLEQDQTFTWPESQISEIASLTHNFRLIADSLQARFYEINSLNAWLEQRIQTRTEELLQERSLLQSLVNSLPDLVFYKDCQGAYLGCNKAFEAFVGCSEASLIGKTDLEIFSTDMSELFQEKNCQTLDRQEPHHHETWVTYPDDRQVLLDIIKTPIWSSQGHILGIISTGRDITARYQIEEELRQSQAMLRLVIDNIPQLIFWKDKSGIYLGCNQNYSQKIGLSSPFEIMGKTDADLMAHHQYPGETFFTVLNQCVNLEGGARYQQVESYIDPNGMPVWFEINKIPLHSVQGEVIGVLGSFEDITELKRVEEKLKQSVKVLENSAEAIVITDAQSHILLVNKSFTEITGYSEAEVLGKRPAILKSGKHDEQFYQKMWRSINEVGHWEGEIWNRRKDGEIYPEWLHISVIKDEIAGEVTNYLAIFSDITLRKRTEQRLVYLAHYDDLTGLPNRALFYERVSRALYHAQQHSGLVAVMFLDLDRFKYVNDTWGHVIGDLLLKEVAYRLAECLNKTDTVARLGGDDFAIVLEHVKNTKEIALIAQTVLNVMLSPFYLQGHETFVTASIGISFYPNDGEDVDTLLKNADAAMYRAKERGRNNYQFFISQMNVHAHERMLLETKLRYALERSEFVLYYQPQLHLASGLIVGAEVLLRWQHPEMGLVLPYHFVSLAEETGLIVPIGEWVLRYTCLQHQQWRDQGKPILRMSVNLSSRQFQRSELVKDVARVVDSTDVDPNLLELELTESTLMQDVDMANKILHQFKEMGIHLAIDDFGTGYSSLSYLKRFPIDKLKIDQSFVRDIPMDKDDMTITRAIVALARSLNLTVIAEGVETLAQQAFLKSLRCDEIQGFLIGRPLPAEDFIQLCEKNACLVSNHLGKQIN